MKKTLTILLCKLARWAGGLLGRGSSLPGRLALKLCPDILARLTLPKYVVAVTGSNGKTSTVELIAHILRTQGLSVAWNKEGSNQIEGVTTLLLSHSTLSGKVKADVVLLESDERYARHSFRWFSPTHYVILNLYRDQLTRNGHPQWMYRIVGESVKPESRLILNADDPLVAQFGTGRDNVAWFGVDAQPGETAECAGAYDDGAYCPRCFAPMTYSYRHFAHIGSYGCDACGHRRPQPDYAGTALDLSAGTLTADGVALPLPMKSWYGAYNTLAAYALCRELGLESGAVAHAMEEFASHAGRVVEFRLGDKNGTLLTSKHENSVSYDQSIRFATQSGKECTVLVIVDAVSRKYFTSETSWLWDIAFEGLAADCVRCVVLSGRYCHDLAVRFAHTGLPAERVQVMEDISQAAGWLREHAAGHIYVITCFSDKDKILSLVEVKA